MSQFPHTVVKSALPMGHRQSRYNIKLLFYQCNRKHHLDWSLISCFFQFLHPILGANKLCKLSNCSRNTYLQPRVITIRSSAPLSSSQQRTESTISSNVIFPDSDISFYWIYRLLSFHYIIFCNKNNIAVGNSSSRILPACGALFPSYPRF